tara:strand:+ start:60472 stop:61296 length:825 start_codon:yes stop_codon:yes gene_type:complete
MSSFKWEVHLSNKAKKNKWFRGLLTTKPQPLPVDTKLPAIYWKNDDYTLKLHEYDQNGVQISYNNSEISGMTQSFRSPIVNVNSKYIPERYFDVLDSVKSLIKSSLNKTIKNPQDLYPIPFWVLILLSLNYSGSTVLKSISDGLISANVSMYSLIIGVMGFVILSAMELLIPMQRDGKIYTFINTYTKLFLSLTVGASAFAITESIVDGSLENLGLLGICLLCHFMQNYYMELSGFLSLKYKICTLSLILGIGSVFLYRNELIDYITGVGTSMF